MAQFLRGRSNPYNRTEKRQTMLERKKYNDRIKVTGAETVS
jgi:hypothetical protein